MDRGGDPRQALPRAAERVPPDEHRDVRAPLRPGRRVRGADRRGDRVRPLLRDRDDRAHARRARADGVGGRGLGGVGRMCARERRAERGHERGLLRRRHRRLARGAARPIRTARRGDRRSAAGRAHGEGAERRRRARGAQDRLRLVQPDDPRGQREGAVGTYGYTLDRVRPVDMFPHTPHIEAVALFTR